MRIGFVVPRCLSTNSHGRYVIELAKRLALSEEVTVYSGAVVPALRDEVRFRYLPTLDWPMVARLSSMWATSVSVWMRNECDIIHVQGADSPVGDIATAHYCTAAAAVAIGTDARRRKFNRVIGECAEKHSFAKTSTRVVIAVSRSVKEEIQRHYDVDSRKVVVIPHGVDATVFHPSNRDIFRSDARRRLGLRSDDFVVLHAGGDYRRKGLLRVVEAAERLNARVRVLAVGVPDDSILRAAVNRGRLIVVGHASDMVPYYSAADCFALPTLYDPFSLAALEAMASGLPVIVSTAAGVSDLIVDGENGYVLANPRDIDLLANRIRTLLEDDAVCAAVGRTARQTAERHSWDDVTEQTLRVYRAASGTRPAD